MKLQLKVNKNTKINTKIKEKKPQIKLKQRE